MRAKNNPISVIMDKRAMQRYDAEIRLVNEQIATLADLLKDNGRPFDNLTLLSVIFVPGWLENEDAKRVDAITDPIVKGLLRDFIPALPESFTEAVEVIRKRILGAVVLVNDIATPMALTEKDFTVIDGELRVSPDHRVRFEKSITHELTESEMEAYNILADCLPKLKALKAQGWNIMPVLEGRIGRLPSQDGVPGLEHLVEDVVKYRPITNKLK